MDNAGGHGTDDCVKEYTRILSKDYNIQIIQQVPRSPETNVLDLGIWMSLQSAVESKHWGKCNNAETLHATVTEVWADVASADAFENVFNKLPNIYHNICSNLGGNDLVEANCGKKGAAAVEALTTNESDEPLFSLDEEEESEVVDDEGENDDDIVNII